MFKQLFGKKDQKVVVLGIDGVPYSLLSRFADQGVMPNFSNLMREGTLCRMTASIPEVSSTSWSTFMTGVNPGRHGIYGFMELERETYSWRFPNFNDLKSKTIWELAGEKGKRCIVLNMPSTYPARPLNGMLVSGFVALDLKKATYPESFYRYLSDTGYRLDVDATKAVKSMDDFIADIQQTFRKRIETIMHLCEKEEWDLFIATVTETDRLHHYLWEALEDDSHPRHDFFMDFYKELNRFIGDFAHKVDNRIPLIMLSDHGFTSIKNEIYLNALLRERGYLKFISENPQSFKEIDSDSKAFALDPSRLYVHLKGRFPRGCVAQSDYESVREKLRDELLALSINGDSVIKEVFRKEELYKGSCFDDAPDLVALPNRGYDLKGTIARREVTGRSALTGGHTQDDAMFYINRSISCHNPNIADVGATVINLLGQDASGLDGRTLV